MAKDYKVNLDVNVKGTSQVDELNDELDEVTENTDEANEAMDGMGGAVNKMTGGALAGFTAMRGAITKTVRGLGVMKAAVMATGLGALLIAIVSITQAFKSSEGGQNKWSKIMSAIGVVVGNVTDVLSALGDIIISVFEDPVKAIENFKEMIRKNIEVRIEAATAMFGFLGSAIKKVFSGDFSGAMEDAINAGKKFVDMNTGIENSVDRLVAGVGDFVAETQKEIDIMNELSERQFALDKQQREAMVTRARLEGEVAELMLNSLNMEKYNHEERLGMLNEAAAKNDEIFAMEEKMARERYELKKAQNELSNSTKEDLQEEAQLEAQMIQVTQQRAAANRRIASQQQSIIRMINSEQQKAHDDEQKRRDEDLKSYEELLEGMEKAREDHGDKMEEMTTREVEQMAVTKGEFWVQSNEDLQNMLGTMEAVGLGWMAQIGDAVIKFRTDSKATVKETIQAVGGMAASGLQAAAGFMNQLADQIDTSTKAGFEKQKKMRMAAVMMDTFAAMIAGMLAGLAAGGPWGIALGVATAAMAGGFGLMQYNKIASTQFESTGSTSVTGPSAPQLSGGDGGGGGPALNLIAPGDGGVSGLAGGIDGSGAGGPNKSYVVSEDMSTQQELDRRIESNAAL